MANIRLTDAGAAASFWTVFDNQRGRLFLWVPVLVAVGIGAFFALKFEPGLLYYASTSVAVLAICALFLWVPEEARPIPTALCLILVGTLLAGGRTHWVAEPVLGFRYYGPIEGRIVKVDRSISDKVRLTLDHVWLERVNGPRLPAKVRVSLHGGMSFAPKPGQRVMMTGHLSPPQGPVEPGGFDFRRMAWFDRLGAVGYTRTPAVLLAPSERGLFVAQLRDTISHGVRNAMPGRSGAFAAAVTTGDRAAMDRDVLEDLRASNLSHLLAISGLHMGLLTGFIFAAIRLALALVPRVALRMPTKKIAAVGALGAGAFYYALSGGNVATERAFIMVAVMFAAVLLDRRAITLRAVAIAALIVLTLRPESLLEPGFQMSFAATTALVVVFGGLSGWKSNAVPRWLRPVLAVVLSSAVAGLATAPVAAAHFNRIADYGLLANVLSVPLMGLVVMPGAVLAALLWPLGLAWIGLAVMRPGIEWILFIAGWVAGLDGSVTPVIAPGGWVLPLLALGALWCVLWNGWARVIGAGPVIAGLLIWIGTERPEVLVADTARLIGQMTDAGRVLSKPRGDGFAAMSWLENDGDAADQVAAYDRHGLTSNPGDVTAKVAGVEVVLLKGRNVEERLATRCAERVPALYVVAKDLDAPSDCLVYDAKKLRETGALALMSEEDALKVVTVRDWTGRRLWSR